MTAPKDPKDYKRIGAPPWEYDSILGEEICEAISLSTDSMKKILEAHPHFPCEKLIRKWRLKIPSFGLMYAQAKMMQAELFAEEVIEIADDSTGDAYVDERGKIKCDNEFVHRSKIRIDTRKWIACKLVPRVYGDHKLEDIPGSHLSKEHSEELRAKVKKHAKEF